MATPIIRRSLRPIALAAVLAAPATAPAAVQAGTYGRLIARHDAAPTASLQTNFANVAPPKAILFVVTEPPGVSLDFRWSVRCAGRDVQHRESGGASGAATVSGGHWVKRVAVAWIRHPTSCAGAVTGTAGSSPVLVRVFAQ
ncbi:MAG: hypothetical protein JWM66_1649 [Solirubrobacterales bacterium]|nr:hypothetical protein [Solirubrobacterales bacterium]